MPTASDLVTDLPADFETFGQAVATSMADLLGGTTGQVLSKASNTDMDFTWVAQDDSNAIQNAIVDAKGDLIAASAADTPARLAVGANNTVLIADSAEATGLKWGGGFTTWTPTYPSGLTAGNGTLLWARYNKIGKMVHAEFGFELGSTSAITGSIYVSLPSTPKNTTGTPAAGAAVFLDAGVAIYPAFPVITGGNCELFGIYAGGTYASYAVTTGSVPFTWGTTDKIYFNITYEEA
jgi:hypothetical protein